MQNMRVDRSNISQGLTAVLSKTVSKSFGAWLWMDIMAKLSWKKVIEIYGTMTEITVCITSKWQ